MQTPKEPDSTYYLSSALTFVPLPEAGPTINGIAFKTPSSPLLYQWQDVNPDNFCEVDDHGERYVDCYNTQCLCIHRLKAKLNEVKCGKQSTVHKSNGDWEISLRFQRRIRIENMYMLLKTLACRKDLLRHLIFEISSNHKHDGYFLLCII